MKVIFIAAGLATGNYIYQYFTGQHWDVATERSFFQLAAVFLTSRAYK